MHRADSDLVPAHRLFWYALVLGIAPLVSRVVELPGLGAVYRILPGTYREPTFLVSALVMALASLTVLIIAGRDLRNAVLGLKSRTGLVVIVLGVGLSIAAIGVSRLLALEASIVRVPLEGASWSEPVAIAKIRKDDCPCESREGQANYRPDVLCIQELLTLNPARLDYCWNRQERERISLGSSLSYLVASLGLGLLVGALGSAFLGRSLVSIKVFFSYRRADSTQMTDRIYDHFADRYGNDNVFKDVDDIPVGSDFKDVILNYLQSSDFVLAVIGPGWLDIKGKDGHRRLENEDDFVRIEIEEALSREDIRVIPVLVGGAEIEKARLPPSLQSLSDRQASTIRNDPDFRIDVGRLMTKLERLKSTSSRRGLWPYSARGKL